MTKIEIFLKISPKSKFWKIWQNGNFSKILLKSKFFEIFEEMEVFKKIWPKWNFFLGKLPKMENIWKFGWKSKFIENFTKIENMTKNSILYKIFVFFFENFGNLTKFEILENLTKIKNRIFFRNIDLNRNFSKILTKIEILEN